MKIKRFVKRKNKIHFLCFVISKEVSTILHSTNQMIKPANLDSYTIILDDYQKIQSMNEGSFGAVYLEKDHLKFAAKVNTLSSMPADSLSLSREPGVLVQVQGQTIIPFYGFSFTDFEGNSSITILMKHSKKVHLNNFLKLKYIALLHMNTITLQNKSFCVILHME